MSTVTSACGTSCSVTFRFVPGTGRWLRHVPFPPVVAQPLCALLLFAGVLDVPAKSNAQATGEVRGQVTDSVTRFGIESVQLTLDLLPGDGIAEATADSDLFGFFEMQAVAVGSYRLRVAHPGYTTFETNVVLTAGAKLHPRLTLMPAAGPGRFDLSLQVVCVTSGVGLQGVPVQVERYNSAMDTAPAELLRTNADVYGNAVFRGVAPGWYGFRINDSSFAAPRPKWDALINGVAAGQHFYLEADHHANVRLKPQKQSLTVTVRGFDPVRNQTNQPLKDFVVELDSPNGFMPTQSSVSDENGEALFTGLPAIGYIATAKRAGYESGQWLGATSPDAAGVLAPITVTPALKPTHLFINLRHPYAHSNFVSGLLVVVEGIEGTLTEGIRRGQSFYDNRFPWQRAFFNLMPGNYRVFVNGVAASGPSAQVRPRFTGEIQARAIEGVFTDYDLPIQAVSARVQGRLFAADKMGAFGADVPMTGFLAVGEPPVYVQPAGVPIEIIEYAGDNFLEAPLRTNLVTTDALGEFTVNLLPARYGIRIPSLTNHFGFTVQMRNHSATIAAEKEIVQRWPFVEVWPYLSGAFNGNPLLIRSTNQYALDLFVLKQIISIYGDVDQEFGNAVDHISNGGTATLRAATGDVATQPLTDTLALSASAEGGYRFTELPPGTYTEVALAHTQFTFDAFGGFSPDPTLVFAPRPAPGVIPASDPSFDFSNPLPFTAIRLTQRKGTYIPPSTSIKVLSYRWRAGAYPPVGSDIFFETTAKLDGRNVYAGGNRDSNLPYGGFDYWISGRGSAVSPEFSIMGHANEGQMIEHEIYWGGGPMDTPASEISAPPQPKLPFTWVIRVVNRHDTKHLVPNETTATLQFDNTNTTRVINGEMNDPAWIGFPGFVRATNPNWVYDSVTTVQTDRTVPSYLTLIKMRRGTSLQGTVRVNSPAMPPLPNVRVQIRDTRGHLLSEVVTDSTGAFVVAAELSSQPVFADISTPGYKPWRKSYTAADAVPVGTADSMITIDAKIDPLPAPMIASVTLDRSGVFFPGLNQVGDLANYQLDYRNKALTLTWTLAAETAGTVSINLPQFETDGVPLPPFLTMQDPLTELWLIDPRSFTNRARSGTPIPLTVPTEMDATRDWLARIASGSISNVLYQRMILPAPSLDPVTVTNSFLIWQLPEGEFNPVFVAVTQRGAIATQNGYAYASDIHQLRGVRMPPWLSSATDVLSSLAAFAEDPQHARNIIPKGRFRPRKAFTAALSHDANGFLNYAYHLPLDWNEGMENPGGELLDFLPAFFGIRFQSGLDFGLRGTNAEVFLRAEAHDVKFDTEPFFEYLPLLVIPIFKESLDARLQGSKQFTPVDDPFEVELTDETSGRFEFGITAQIDLPFEKYFSVPSSGSFKRLRAGGAEATLKGAIELQSRKEWRTLFPPPRPDSSSTDPLLDQVFRRHFLGGHSEMSKSFDLCLYGEASVNLTTPLNILEATIGLAIQGTTCANGLPSARFGINPTFDWPPMTGIQAEFDVFAEFALDYWYDKHEARFDIPLIKINRDFTTEAVFQLVPVRIVKRIITPATAPPGVFSATGPTRVASFYAAGSFATASSTSGHLLAYTDVDPPTGQMLLRIARRDASGAWQSPVTVATAAGVLNVALARSAREWLAVWTQLAATDAGNPSPPSTLMFALSADGAAWTAPALLANLSGVAAELRLAASVDQAMLAFLETEDGPLAEDFALKTATWNGSAWTAPASVLGSAPVRAFELEGVPTATTPSFQLAWQEEGGALRSIAGSPFDAASARTLATNAFKTFDLLADGSGPALATWRNKDQHIELARLDGVNWISLGVVLSNAVPSDLHLLRQGGGTEAKLLLAWTAGSPAAINYAWLDVSGQTLQPPTLLTSEAAQSHRDLELTSAPDGAPRLFALRQAASSAARLAPQAAAPPGTVSLVELAVPFSAIRTGPQLKSPRLTTDGRIEFFILGDASQRFRVQASTDLRTWTDVAAGIAPSDTVPFRDPIGTSMQRYYRAVTP